MLPALRTGLVAMVILAGAAPSIVSTAAAAGSCVPPPNLVLVQVTQIAGSNPALLADVQAVEQADATQGDKSGGQAIQDILVAAGRHGYQWDCTSSRLVAPNSTGQPPAAAAAAAKLGAAGGAAVAAGRGGSGGASDGSANGSPGGFGATSGASGSPSSANAQAAPAAGTTAGNTSNIPIPVIVVGLVLCSAALFAAVRRVSRH